MPFFVVVKMRGPWAYYTSVRPTHKDFLLCKIRFRTHIIIISGPNYTKNSQKADRKGGGGGRVVNTSSQPDCKILVFFVTCLGEGLKKVRE